MGTGSQYCPKVTNATKWSRIPVEELKDAVWQGRVRLIQVTAVGLVIGIAIAFLIPSRYTSTAGIIPPDRHLLTSGSFAALGANALLPSYALGMANAETPAGTTIGILRSVSCENTIIDRFDLRRVYHDRYYADARKRLAARTKVQVDRSSGIISLAVSDSDPHRAQAIAGAYIEVINSLLNAVNSSSARREREFLGTRLKSLRSTLDDTSAELSAYSSRNATLNPQGQGQAIIEAATKLQAELITAQSELDGLRSQYTDQNVRVEAARARVQELEAQLKKLGGVNHSKFTSQSGLDSVYPNIRQLPLLGVEYAKLYKQLTMQEDIYVTLSKQYELAKVEEAKNIPVIHVLDPPTPPERRSFPPRLLIILITTCAFAIGGCSWLVGIRLGKLKRNSYERVS